MLKKEIMERDYEEFKAPDSDSNDKITRYVSKYCHLVEDVLYVYSD